MPPWIGCWRCHVHKTDLSDFHAGIQRDWQVGYVRQLKCDVAVKPGVNKTSRGVNEKTKTAERGLTFKPRNEVGGKTNALAGGPEHEFTWVQHEGVVGADLDEFGEILEVLLHVDVAHRVIPEHPEEPIDMEIDR